MPADHLPLMRIRPSSAMRNAETYAEWLSAAEAADQQSGAAEWRAEDDSELLAGSLMREHIRQLRQVRERNDALATAALLHESLYRHQGDIANPHLYNTAFAGTKHVVADYMAEVEIALNFIVDCEVEGLHLEKKLTLLRGAEKNLGRSALLLSGGASMGFFHLGVVKALLENGLLPQTICGASIGSLIGGGVCSRTDDELLALFSDVEQIYRLGIQFLKPAEMLRQRSVLSQKQLYRCAAENMGEMTFAEAAKHSGRDFCVSVSPSRSRQKPRVLSPSTSPNVLVANAVMASCAIPGLFPAVRLQAREPDGSTHAYLPGETWVDGTFQGDLPMKRLGRLFNVNHFIVSQVNPHAVPFLASRHGRGALAMAADLGLSSARMQTAQTLKVIQARVVNPKLHNILEHGRLIAEQEYKGDINIHPPLSGWMYRKMLSNPSVKDLHRYIEYGERATWPQLAQIHNQTRVLRCVADCVKRLKAQ